MQIVIYPIPLLPEENNDPAFTINLVIHIDEKILSLIRWTLFGKYSISRSQAERNTDFQAGNE